MQKPALRKRLVISPIWFLPLLALCIGIWLLYTSYRDAGVNIDIHVQTAEGITPGKTKVIYKGIPVGTVTDVAVNPTLDGVTLHVEMQKETRASLVEDTVFWLVKPVISAGRISGLETLLSGTYIGVRPGTSTVTQRHFKGLATPPPTGSDTPGLHLTLETDTLYSLQRGSNIYSKNLKIGTVEEYWLGDDGRITVEIFIEPEFSHLVREDTRFWNSSGLSVSGDLQSGMSVNVESMAALIYGGLTCATPKALKDSPQAQNGRTYQLYKDFADAEYGVEMTLQLASGDGIVPGKTRVMYRGLRVGVVRSIDINHDQFHTVTARILLDPRAEVILRENSRFWVMRPLMSLEGVKNLSTLVSGVYITFQVGEGVRQDHFTVESTPMPKPYLPPGTRFILLSDDPGSLKAGAPVLYKKREVGEIADIRFSQNGRQVETEILIHEKFTGLVNKSSRFYNGSGISMSASLRGISVNTESMASIISGGIAFFTPQTSGKPVEEGQTFPLYDNREKADNADSLMLTLQFDSGMGLNPRAKIRYKGVAIGELTRIWFDADKDKVFATAAVQQKTRKLFRDRSVLWMERPQLSLAGVTNLDTVIGGAYINILPGKGKSRTRFKVRDSAPLLDGGYPGLHLVLESPRLGSLKIGRPIHYRQVTIGKVTGVELGPTAQNVWIHIVIEPKYTPLVRRGSRFWNSSGINLTGGIFSGISVEAESFETLMAGGVAMATPDGKQMGTPARNEDHFILANKVEEGWLEWAPEIMLPSQSQAKKEVKGTGNGIELKPGMKKVKIK